MHAHNVSTADLVFHFVISNSLFTLFYLLLCRVSHIPTTLQHRRHRFPTDRCTGAVYLSKLTGGPVTDEEARDVLGGFGAIEETCPTTVADQQMHGLPEGIWVKFAYFMDCKDAIAVICPLPKGAEEKY